MDDNLTVNVSNNIAAVVENTTASLLVSPQNNNVVIEEVQLENQVVIQAEPKKIVIESSAKGEKGDKGDPADITPEFINPVVDARITLLFNSPSLGVKTYWLTRSAAVIKKINNSYDVPVVTLSAFSQTGSSLIQPYAGLFKVRVKNLNGLWSDLYMSASPESVVNVAIPNNILSLNYKLFSANDSNNMLDEESTTIVEDGISYDVKIVSSNGIIFRVNEARTTMLIAKVFRNGVDVTDTIPESKFKWTRVSADPKPPPYDDAAWNMLYQTGYKQILITIDDVDSKATFFCEILE